MGQVSDMQIRQHPRYRKFPQAKLEQIPKFLDSSKHQTQPATSSNPQECKGKLQLSAKYLQRKNLPVFGGEVCYHSEIGINGRLNHPKKGSFQSQIKGVSLIYDGTTNSAVGFEMLQGLKPGINYIWEIGYQRLISKNLQLSINYNGRKSENSSTIHSGSMELRALF